MTQAILYLVHIIEYLIFSYLAFAAIYIILFGVPALFYRLPQRKTAERYRKIAVLIPGYKEDKVIVGVARDALTQNYPKDLFEVIVIADSFKSETIQALWDIPVRVIEVVFEVSKKSRALNKCMEIIGDQYDVAFILDADNIMENNVLLKVNETIDSGFLALQCHRTAKNLNTPFAILDAISEEINNNIFRKGHRAIGLSSALIGSGMGFDYKLYKSLMADIDSVGEDKELELKLLRNGIKIEYLDSALVYDEKTSREDVFVNQRRRWLAAQIAYVRTHLPDGFIQLITKGNIDYFDKVIQFIQPPRILLLGISFSMTVVYLLLKLVWPELDGQLALSYLHWAIVFSISSLILLLNTPRKFLTMATFKALFYLPIGFILMIKSLIKIKGATKKFIHTSHEHSDHDLRKRN